MVRLLLTHGAELEVVNSNQQTPVDCAHSRVREVLFLRRASISHKSTSSASNTLPLVSVRVGYGEGDEGEWVGEWVGVGVRGKCDGEAEMDIDLVCMTAGRKVQLNMIKVAMISCLCVVFCRTTQERGVTEKDKTEK